MSDDWTQPAKRRAQGRWGDVRVYSEAKKVDGRVPRHHLDSEAAVLATCVLDPKRIGSIRDLLADGDAFFSDQHRMIWKACLDLVDQGEPVDVVQVASTLRDRELLQRVGGSTYLGGLVDKTPAVENVLAHARVVHRLWLVRRFVAKCQLYAAEGYGDVGDVHAWLSSAAHGLQEIANEAKVREAVTGGEAAREGIEQAERRRADQGVDLSTGFWHLDGATAGLHSSDHVTLTAETGGGKTAFACSLAIRVARLGRGVGIISLEQPMEQLATRMVCSLGRVNWHAVRLGKHVPDVIVRMSMGGDELRGLPILIDDERKQTIGKIRSKVLRMRDRFEKMGKPIGLVLIDYIQKVNGRELCEHRDTRERELGKVTEALYHLSEDVDACVMSLAQLNADGQIRESKAILQESTGWWDLKGVKKQTRTGSGPRAVRIKIDKQRNAPSPATAPFWFHPGVMWFDDEENIR
jgi:replicative DNA helicase